MEEGESERRRGEMYTWREELSREGEKGGEERRGGREDRERLSTSTYCADLGFLVSLWEVSLQVQAPPPVPPDPPKNSRHYTINPSLLTLPIFH